MTTSAVPEVAAAEPAAATRPIEHLLCCEVREDEPGVTLCGSAEEYWNGRYWSESRPEDRCVVCDDLDARDACPLYVTCRHALTAD